MGRNDLDRALALLESGDWQAAHEIVQEHEDDRTASWIHAVVHRMEGDLDNARYWYRRCGREPGEALSFEAELRQIQASLDARG